MCVRVQGGGGGPQTHGLIMICFDPVFTSAELPISFLFSGVGGGRDPQ
jgi:hypothetical protein